MTSVLDRGSASGAKIRAVRAGLYAIVDLEALAGRDPLAFVDDLLAAGRLPAIQLRAKRASAREVLAVGRAIAARCTRARVPFFMNDRVDLALLCGSDGVHVGQDDLTVRAVRAMAPNLAIGLSTHGPVQAREALAEGVDYVAFGPVFPTVSKRNPDPVVGIDGLRAVCAAAGGVPVVAIGGVTLDHAGAVRETGARSAAVIGALVAATERTRVTETARMIHHALGGS